MHIVSTFHPAYMLPEGVGARPSPAVTQSFPIEEGTKGRRGLHYSLCVQVGEVGDVGLCQNGKVESSRLLFGAARLQLPERRQDEMC